MSDVVFTVRGTHRIARTPERGTVFLAVGFEGPAKESVWSSTADTATRLVEEVRRLHDPAAGPVTWWAQDQLQTSAHRPWNQEGKVLPLVHSARTVVRVKFSDLPRLGSFLGEVADWPGLSVEGIDWTLTEALKVQLTRDVRAAAVRDAQVRAQEYADALGLGTVRPVEVADAGMLAQGLHAAAGEMVMMSRADKSGAAMTFAPEDIEISAQVDARFVAEGDRR